ncbi:MAG TPA: metalloregulator ArsR/SmtB family transcription factor [Acetobacteraceae bacterium]|nr:metalloregulator ArsR/SmtB family transcription factor [Acetobacteraceae bacterium]
MEPLLAALRAAAEPTRLRILALAGRGAFCVSEFTEILGQSQPRLSRHLKLLCEAGLLARVREGANVWFAVPIDAAGSLTRELLARLPADDPVLESDRRQGARVLAERARIASESFQRKGADWDEMRALDLPAPAVEASLLMLVPEQDGGRLLDIGTGTGRVLELLGPRMREGLGVDASRAMLALARARLARAGLAHCSVRLADMYRLPLPDSGFDLAVLQMVLHHADDPERVLLEAARTLSAGGRLIVIDLASHHRTEVVERLAHRWPGFGDDLMHRWLTSAGLSPGQQLSIPGAAALPVRIWCATRTETAPVARRVELAV